MAIAQLVLSYLQVLVWPCVAIFALIKYRKFFERVIESLASQSEVTVPFAGITLKIPLKTLERSLEDNLRGRELSEEQLEWLRTLSTGGRIAFNYEKDYKPLSPLRNAGLIWEYPVGYLTAAKEVEITALGKLLFERWEQSQKSH